MKTRLITKLQIEHYALDSFLNELEGAYNVISLSHSTYVLDTHIYHSVIAIVAA